MTLAAITMTAPEAASPVQMYRATYSPDDNKLRLYAVSRLDPETYKKVHDAGFRWAPKQALFVAPAWTPGREDVLLSLAGEIEDEDSTLAERQEARAERFTGYSGKRASESAQALDEVERLAAMIPPGQPILVGHHSERRARRDAQRIENGMKRAVMLFERAEYWEAELAAKKAQARQALSIYLNLPTLDEAVNTLKPWWPGLFDGDTPRLLACGIRDVLLEDVAQRNIPLSHKKLRRALKAITRSESYLCAMKAGACRYDTEGYVTEHISQEEEAYAAARLDKIRRQNRIKAELQAVLDEK